MILMLFKCREPILNYLYQRINKIQFSKQNFYKYPHFHLGKIKQWVSIYNYINLVISSVSAGFKDQSRGGVFTADHNGKKLVVIAEAESSFSPHGLGYRRRLLGLLRLLTKNIHTDNNPAPYY